MAKQSDEVLVEAAGREIRITSPAKVMFEERGDTKLDLVEYYLAIEDEIMNAVQGRVVLMQRFDPEADRSAADAGYAQWKRGVERSLRWEL